MTSITLDNFMEHNKTTYQSPEIKIVELTVENGLATSFVAPGDGNTTTDPMDYYVWDEE